MDELILGDKAQSVRPAETPAGVGMGFCCGCEFVIMDVVC